jgi:hypothetical protein
MAGKLQPKYSGNPGNNKYKGIMAKQFYGIFFKFYGKIQDVKSRK